MSAPSVADRTKDTCDRVVRAIEAGRTQLAVMLMGDIKETLSRIDNAHLICTRYHTVGVSTDEVERSQRVIDMERQRRHRARKAAEAAGWEVIEGSGPNGPPRAA